MAIRVVSRGHCGAGDSQNNETQSKTIPGDHDSLSLPGSGGLLIWAAFGDGNSNATLS